MADTGTLTWTNGHGREESHVIHWRVDLREFRGTPAHAHLLVAANRHLSITGLENLLEVEGVPRSRSWIQRRRWLSQQPDAVNALGRPDADRMETRALEIIRAHPRMSARALSKLLAECGIPRGKDWVWKNRCR